MPGGKAGLEEMKVRREIIHDKKLSVSREIIHDKILSMTRNYKIFSMTTNYPQLFIIHVRQNYQCQEKLSMIRNLNVA